MADGVREWSPSPGLVVCAWLGAAIAAVGCTALLLSGADPAGQLLSGIATIGLLVAAAFGSRARPRLRADADGVTIGGMWRSRHHPWPLVRDVRVLRIRRWGRMSSLLEVDAVTAGGDERLAVFGRLDLAADPEDVMPELLALRP
ncbi:PH domain-containing protein [Pseudonocardia sp. TRM90224]|uniref:PH domain-containing protein n=1 Tax=Pseudonocardia sp. TRM90224 TaxID=2812678 RepID=UPI001E391EA7|nr:PH domain-containing protein [Pseudonocardia sp. TRM90224]